MQPSVRLRRRWVFVGQSRTLPFWETVRKSATLLEISFALCKPPGVWYKIEHGEMSERLKEHDWKSCARAKTRAQGSNPCLSANYDENQALRNVEAMNPVRFGRKQRQ
jgi:hypothetical protein